MRLVKVAGRFSMILKKSFPISRIQLISLLENKKIEYRPIVSGNFLKNKNALRYFDYEIHDTRKCRVFR